MLRILKYISVLWLLSNCAAAFATPTATTPPAQPENAVTADSLKPQAPTRGIQFDATADSLLQLQKNAPLFAGFSVSGDLVGVIMAATSSRGQYEGAFRLNLKGKYFPILKLGSPPVTTRTKRQNPFQNQRPFFRIGCDYNFARDIHAGGRILGGLRYGFSKFDYDTDALDIIDPIWGDRLPFAYKGLSGNTHWAEVVFGLEAKYGKSSVSVGTSVTGFG